MLAVCALAAMWHRKKPRNKKESGNKGKPAADQGGNRTPVTGAVVEIPEPILKEYRTNQEANQRESRHQKYIAIGGVVGAWIYAGIAVFQWCAMGGGQ